MHPNPTEILVFKTNLQSIERIEAVRPLLDAHPEVNHWNVDIQDVDHVLRVVPQKTLAAEDIITLVSKAGLFCEELPD